MHRLSIISLVAVGVFVGWACGDAVPSMFPDAGADAGDDGSVSGTRIEVRPIAYTGDDGSVIRTYEEYIDTELDARCTPSLANDGQTRCVPYAPHWTATDVTFADDECTVPLRAWTKSCEEPTMFLRVSGESFCDDRAIRVLAMEPYEGPIYTSETSEGGGCALFENPSWDGLPLATIGAELLPSEMVALTR